MGLTFADTLQIVLATGTLPGNIPGLCTYSGRGGASLDYALTVEGEGLACRGLLQLLVAYSVPLLGPG